MSLSPPRSLLSPTQPQRRASTIPPPRSTPAIVQKALNVKLSLADTNPRQDFSTSFKVFRAMWEAVERIQVLEAQSLRLTERAAQLLLGVRKKFESSSISSSSALTPPPSPLTPGSVTNKDPSHVFRLQGLFRVLFDCQLFVNSLDSEKDRMALLVLNLGKTQASLEEMRAKVLSAVEFYGLEDIDTSAWSSQDAQDLEADIAALPRLFKLSVQMRGPTFDAFSATSGVDVTTLDTPGKKRDAFVNWCLDSQPALKQDSGKGIVMPPPKPAVTRALTGTLPNRKSQPLGEMPPRSASSVWAPKVGRVIDGTDQAISRKSSIGEFGDVRRNSFQSINNSPSIFEEAAEKARARKEREASGHIRMPSLTGSITTKDLSQEPEELKSPSLKSPSPRRQSTSSFISSISTGPKVDKIDPVEVEVLASEPSPETPTTPTPPKEASPPTPKKESSTKVALPPAPVQEKLTPATSAPPSSSPKGTVTSIPGPAVVKSTFRTPTKQLDVLQPQSPVSAIPLDKSKAPQSPSQPTYTNGSSLNRQSSFTMDKQVARSGAKSPVPRNVDGPMPLRVLSLDGGGTRGLMILIILQELMDLIRRSSGLPFTPKPCDYFDLICGSSTGGLMAILLGRLQMDVETAKETYLDMARGVFGKEKGALSAFLGKTRFSARNLEREMQDVVGRVERNSTATMRERSNSTDGRSAASVPMSGTGNAGGAEGCRSFVLAQRGRNDKPRPIRSYEVEAEKDQEEVQIWQAARATNAVPSFFKPISLEDGMEPMSFEGALERGPRELEFNNPSLHALEEVMKVYPDRELDLLVSIGTGRLGESWLEMGRERKVGKSKTKVLHGVVDISHACERVASNASNRAGMDEDKYFRFNIDLKEQRSHALIEELWGDEWDPLLAKKVEQRTREQMRREVGLERCATRLRDLKMRQQEKEGQLRRSRSSQVLGSSGLPLLGDFNFDSTPISSPKGAPSFSFTQASSTPAPAPPKKSSTTPLSNSSVRSPTSAYDSLKPVPPKEAPKPTEASKSGAPMLSTNISLENLAVPDFYLHSFSSTGSFTFLDDNN